jgi:hypothetical protein
MTTEQDEQHITLVQEMTAQRAWIINSFAQVEFVLLDLVLQMRRFAEYDDHAEKRPPFGIGERMERVRLYCGMPGPLAKHAFRLIPILDSLADMSDDRHFLVHGFCMFVYTPTGDKGLRFRRFVQGRKGEPDMLRAKTFRPEEMEAFQRYAIEFVQRAMSNFFAIYQDLGLSDPDPEVPMLF